MSIIINHKPNITDIKKELLSLQKEYDNSSEVNSFYINEKTTYLILFILISIPSGLSKFFLACSFNNS